MFRSLWFLILAISSLGEKPKIVPLQELGTRIFSGKNATIGQFPFQAALYITTYTGQHYFCGGTLITHKHILTAGQCTVSADTVTVFLGMVDVSDTQKQIYHSAKIKTHPAYNKDPPMFDVGVIELDQSVTFSDRIQPVRLSYDALDANLSVIIIGFGQINVEDTPDINTLQYATLKTITNKDCADKYTGYIYSDVVCAKGSNKESICKGDSGGPLLLESTSGFVQVGIASFGPSSGCTDGYPVGFTRVSEEQTFIETYASSTSNIRVFYILEITCVIFSLYIKIHF